MSKVKIAFKKCIQDSQDFGSDDEHMVSRIFFDLGIYGKIFPEIYVDVKQIVGGHFETDPIEVGKPIGYEGPFNYAAFREEAERYYRGLVGSQGSGIRIAKGGHVRMRDNVFIKTVVVELDISKSDMGW